MIKIPYDHIIERKKKEGNISESEIDVKIDQKMKQLSGLISKEGAAHIIANELGSGFSIRSESSTLVNPTIEEPSSLGSPSSICSRVNVTDDIVV